MGTFVFFGQLIVCLLIVSLFGYYFTKYHKHGDRYHKHGDDDSKKSAILEIKGHGTEEIDTRKFLDGLQVKTTAPIGKENDIEYSHFIKDELLPFRVISGDIGLSNDKKDVHLFLEIDLSKPTRLSVPKTMDGYDGIREIPNAVLGQSLEVINNEYDILFEIVDAIYELPTK